MELPLAEVVLSPRLHLRKAYVLERRPFLFCQSQNDCLGIRAPLKGRGGQTFPAHRSKARLEVEVETRQRASSKRKARAVLGELSARARISSRSKRESEAVKPPRLSVSHLSRRARTRASEKKSAWRGATPPPSRQAKEARFRADRSVLRSKRLQR